MIIKNTLNIFLITLLCNCYKYGTCQSYNIERQCDKNSCNVTLAETVGNGNVAKTTCQGGLFLLQINDNVTCIKNTVLEEENKCEVLSKLPSSGQLSGNEIEVKKYGETEWMNLDGFQISCIYIVTLKSASYIKVNESQCKGIENYAGYLFKVQYKSDGLLSPGCLVFTLDGKVDRKTQITPIPVTTKTTTDIENSTSKGTIQTSQGSTIIPQSSFAITVNGSTTKATKLKSEATDGNIPDTPISNDPEEDKILYIILPICLLLFFLVVVILCLICFRRRKREKSHEVPLLEINSGQDVVDTEEQLYALPEKKKQKKQKLKENTLEQSPPVWSGYDEVGALIEGTYAAQDSIIEDPDSNFGVSAKLLKDDRMSTLNPNTAVIDDPYEKLGRCNSFKNPSQRGKYQEQRIKDDDDEDDDDDDILAKQQTDQMDGFKEENDHEKSTSLKRYSPTLQMSSFKPGNSMRRKQERTSIRKPKGTQNNSSLTHEVVNITPQPSKKLSKVDIKETSDSEKPFDADNEEHFNSEKELDAHAKTIEEKQKSSLKRSLPKENSESQAQENAESLPEEDGHSLPEENTNSIPEAHETKEAQPLLPKESEYEKVDNNDELEMLPTENDKVENNFQDDYEKIDSISFLKDEGKSNSQDIGVDHSQIQDTNETQNVSKKTNDDLYELIDNKPTDFLDNGDGGDLANSHYEKLPLPDEFPYSPEETPPLSTETPPSPVDPVETSPSPVETPVDDPPPKVPKANYADIEIMKDKKKQKKKNSKKQKLEKTSYVDVIIDDE